MICFPLRQRMTHGRHGKSILQDKLAYINMIDNIILAIVIFLFTLPICLSLSVGYNRVAKIELVLIVLGVLGIGLSRYMIHENAVHAMQTANYSNLDSNGFYINIWAAGLVVMVCGGCTLFIGSLTRVWQRRANILPFLFG